VRKDKKGGRTRREGEHEGREVSRGGRTHREGGGGEALWTAPTKERKPLSE